MKKEPSSSEEVEELANLISKKITWTTNMVIGLAYDIIQAGYSCHPKKKELRELDIMAMRECGQEAVRRELNQTHSWKLIRIVCEEIYKEFGSPEEETHKCKVCDKEAFANQQENGWRCRDHVLFGYPAMKDLKWPNRMLYHSNSCQFLYTGNTGCTCGVNKWNQCVDAFMEIINKGEK